MARPERQLRPFLRCSPPGRPLAVVKVKRHLTFQDFGALGLQGLERKERDPLSLLNLSYHSRGSVAGVALSGPWWYPMQGSIGAFQSLLEGGWWHKSPELFDIKIDNRVI